MAHVVQCDQCKKVGDANSMKSATLEIDRDDRVDNEISGDFCSIDCLRKFIELKLQALWYNANRY